MTTIGHYRYEIDDNNEVRIWDNENPYEDNAPFFHQPNYPDNTPWENREAAETWVVNMLNELIDAETARLNQPEEPVEE